MKQMMGFTRGGWQTLAALACVQASACGGVSTDERWETDTHELEPTEPTGCAGAEPTPAGGADPGSTALVCVPPLPAEYGYAEPPSFWLGTQSVGSFGIQGEGYFVALDLLGEQALRFSREVDVFVSPDGTLEDGEGRALLGYPYDRLDLSCLGPLRAPATVPPAPTRNLSLQVNLDSRSTIVSFDIEDPSNTSNTSVSFSVFDSLGAARTVDIYFQHIQPLTWGFHALVDGDDIEGGMPGQYMEIGRGSLAFTDTGALANVVASDLCASFSRGADPDQCVSIGLRATSFAATSKVWGLSADGTAPGTAVFAGFDPDGTARVFFDNGTMAPFGVLALARFPRERALAEGDDGTFNATPASGPEQLDLPGTAGRGVVYHREAEVGGNVGVQVVP
jgi:flagellar hook-basal body protein